MQALRFTATPIAVKLIFSSDTAEKRHAGADAGGFQRR
jgi:hypothetical protein